MIKALQKLPVGQRRIVFVLLMLGGLLVIVLITFALFGLSTGGRSQPTALIPAVAVREFATLPDPDAYPAAVAAAPDGTLYTGSFATGAVWSITTDGVVIEIPNTRDTIGGVSGIAVATDGSLIVLDQIDTDPRTRGGAIWHVSTEGVITPYGSIDDEQGFIAPNDIVYDAEGAFYITDSGRNEVWRFVLTTDGVPEGSVWWTPPSPPADTRTSITGLAYDSLNRAILISDPETNTIYRVPVVDGAAGEFAIIYQHGERLNPPGFDGLTVAANGDVYAAALGQNGIARVDIQANRLEYIAGLFRGASDVEFAAPDRLYVPNFDQTSLIIPFTAPSLPFSIDVITLQSLSEGA